MSEYITKNGYVLKYREREAKAFDVEMRRATRDYKAGMLTPSELLRVLQELSHVRYGNRRNGDKK